MQGKQKIYRVSSIPTDITYMSALGHSPGNGLSQADGARPTLSLLLDPAAAFGGLLPILTFKRVLVFAAAILAHKPLRDGETREGRNKNLQDIRPVQRNVRVGKVRAVRERLSRLEHEAEAGVDKLFASERAAAPSVPSPTAAGNTERCTCCGCRLPRWQGEAEPLGWIVPVVH
jgi:hypothetical protein